MWLASILLALAWAALQGDFSLWSLATGYGFGFVVLYVLGRGGVVPRRMAQKTGQAIGLAAFFLWEIVLANVRVALDVVRPGHTMTPAVVAIPLDVTSDAEILLLSALINITPGSVTIDLSDDRRTLYVHVMHMVTVEQTRREIKHGFERRIQQLFN